MIKFALELREGKRARTLDEVRTYFDLEKMVAYFLDGRLQNWLESRCYQKELALIAVLEKDQPEFLKRFCEIFGVDYDGVSIDLVVAVNNLSKMTKIQQYTTEKEILQSIDQIACTQEELVELLHKGLKKIYLCGDAFCIPEYWGNMYYIGINKPKITIDSRKETFLCYHTSSKLRQFMNELDCQKSGLFFQMEKEFLQNEPLIVCHPAEILKERIDENLCKKSKNFFTQMKEKCQENSMEEKESLKRMDDLKKKNIFFENVRIQKI